MCLYISTIAQHPKLLTDKILLEIFAVGLPLIKENGFPLWKMDDNISVLYFIKCFKMSSRESVLSGTMVLSASPSTSLFALVFHGMVSATVIEDCISEPLSPTKKYCTRGWAKIVRQ